MLATLYTKFCNYMTLRKIRKLSPIGQVIYGYLHDPSLKWCTNGLYLWVEDRSEQLLQELSMTSPNPDHQTSPCMLKFCNDPKSFQDPRAPTLTDADRLILRELVRAKLEEIKLADLDKYKDLHAQMIVNKLNGTR